MVSTLSLSLLALAAVVSAQRDPIEVGDLVGDVSDDQWNDITSSNAESVDTLGNFDITGRNIAEAFPGDSQDGWSLAVAVQRDVEVDGLEGEDRLVATTITISAPEGETADNFDDSWRVCMHVFRPKEAYTPDWETPFGDPRPGDECADDLKKLAWRNFYPGCPSYEISASCLQYMEEIPGESISISSDNSDLFFSGNSSFYRSADGTEGPDETDVYYAAGKRGYAVVIVWGSSDEDDSGDDAVVDLHFVNPHVTGEGADPPVEPEEGAAPSMAAFFGWTVVSGVVALKLLL